MIREEIDDTQNIDGLNKIRDNLERSQEILEDEIESCLLALISGSNDSTEKKLLDSSVRYKYFSKMIEDLEGKISQKQNRERS